MVTVTRREFLYQFGAGAVSLALSSGRVFAADDSFRLPKLPYAYDALEPHIDAETMRIHHDLHHQAYVDGLNKAVAKHPELAKKGVDALLRDIDQTPQEIRQAITNMGGGHANHTLFWEIMTKNGGGQPVGELAKALNGAFGSFDKFQQQVNQAGLTRFGSGWAWLVYDLNATKLGVVSTGNQDSPWMKNHFPVLGVDVWEHAYYLKYRNRRADYLKGWWNVVNWDAVAARYARALRAR